MAGRDRYEVAEEAWDRRLLFRPLPSRWSRLGSATAAKARRIGCGICVQCLALDGKKVGELRYQLFHRTAVAVLEARQYRAEKAVLMVHSFCPQQ